MKHRSEIRYDESRHLAEGTEVAHLRRRFFVSQEALLFGTRHHLCRQGVTLASRQQLRPQGPMPVQAHCTEGRTRSEGREGTNGDGNGVKDRKENGEGDGDGDGDRGKDGNGNGDGDGCGGGNGAETGTGTREVAKTRTGMGTGVEIGAGAGTRTGTMRERGGEEGRELGCQPYINRSVEDLEEGATPTGNQQSQPRHLTPQ